MSRRGEKDQIRGIESSKGVQREGRCRPIAAAQKQALQRTTVDTPANPARDGPPRETESNTEKIRKLQEAVRKKSQFEKDYDSHKMKLNDRERKLRERERIFDEKSKKESSSRRQPKTNPSSPSKS